MSGDDWVAGTIAAILGIGLLAVVVTFAAVFAVVGGAGWLCFVLLRYLWRRHEDAAARRRAEAQHQAQLAEIRRISQQAHREMDAVAAAYLQRGGQLR